MVECIKCGLNLSLRYSTPRRVWVACLAPCYSENEIFPVNYASSGENLDTSRDPQSVSDADMYSLPPHTRTYLNTHGYKWNLEICNLGMLVDTESPHRPRCSVMSRMVLMIHGCASVLATEQNKAAKCASDTSCTLSFWFIVSYFYSVYPK